MARAQAVAVGGRRIGVERRVLRASGFVPVEAKLRLPTQPEGLVVRGQVVDRLLESAHTPVVLVTAPPGYGKSVVVQQWAAEDDRPFAWLSLDPEDDDPVVFITYLMLAMQRLEPVDAGILALLADDQHTIEDVVLPRLGRMMRSRHRPFVLVLDDVDAVTSPACLSIVSALAKHLPDGSQLVLLGRASPALDWNDMLAKRRVVEIGMNQLRLSPAEAEALVEATG